ncbi:hypothetical protein CDAR_574491 [Caerostris darwini]|uniref:Uncharacterized protein n=1 Tax=Caerostris darwini TaxID=1538125 RepID=A0AAV4UIC8_9ARAC|nr:hypothetical protein CDAR_574491 [Caerostris darwini]
MSSCGPRAMPNNSATEITVAITITPTWRTALRQELIIATHSFRATSEFNFRESFTSELLRSKGSNQKWNFCLFLSRNVNQESGDFIGHLKPRKDRKINGLSWDRSINPRNVRCEEHI